MFLDNGTFYVGKYTVAADVVGMCEALGVVVNEEIVAKLQTFCGKALYKSSIGAAPDGIVIALQARKALSKALDAFVLSPDTYAVWETWQQADANAAKEKAALETMAAQATALVEKLGLPADAITVKATTPLLKSAGDAKVVWITALRNDFDAAVHSTVKPKAVAKYLLDNVRGVKGNGEVGNLDKSLITVPIPGRRGGGRAKSGGTGNRVRYMIPTIVAGIDWEGSWRKQADALARAKLVKADSNFYRHPALERAASAMKKRTFVFGEQRITGEYVLAHLEEFTTA